MAVITLTKGNISRGNNIFFTKLVWLVIAIGDLPKISAKKLKTLTLRTDLVKAKCEKLRKRYTDAIKIYWDIIQNSAYLITEALPELVDLHKQLTTLDELNEFIKKLSWYINDQKSKNDGQYIWQNSYTNQK